MAKQAKKQTVEATAEEAIVANAETIVSNFAGSAEEAFDEAFKKGEEDGTGKAALLATGIIAAKHAKVLRGKVVKGKEEEFQANILALRMRYVAGFNKVAEKLNPLDVIATVGEKAEKANKKQANKLGAFVKAGCVFDKPEDAEAYVNRIISTLAKTDFSKAKTRESTFERVAKVLRKVDAAAVKESDEALAERCKPEEKEEESTTTAEVATDTTTETPQITAAEALKMVGSELSVIVAKYAITGQNAVKLNAMVNELDAMSRMVHAADAAEAMSDAKQEDTKAA